jgi:hypothetical protein
MPTREEYARTVEGWIEHGVNVGTSADALYDVLRNSEFYAPRSVVREVWNETVRGISYVPNINALGEDEGIPRSWVHSTSWKYEQPFAATVKITGKDPFTQEVSSEFVTVLYGNMPTTGQILSDASDLAQAEETYPLKEQQTFEVQRISHVFGARWSTP